jgi:hypothetical protein
MLLCRADKWFCPWCVREGRAPGLAAANERLPAPHPAVARDEYHRCAQLLGTTEYSECAPAARSPSLHTAFHSPVDRCMQA